ncbi:TonB-dependent receptor [Chitinophaga lutea]|uniref:TonB-dependent receptor n=1 Tax=Chitinophaga lutea TaxID=2488634 RepID=A0A3N4PLY9_9BACT|nr:TonB-dependent receptor [Chitinophaga lutea]RPE05901.1 TonB-dependent receptor [Chitinophaga lutea]
MKKLLVAVLWAILASPFQLLSQTPVKPIINSTLSGRVTDRTTKEPVPGAAVKIKGTTHGVSADEHGNFNFVTGQKFPYILIISSVGYQPVELTVNGGHVEIPLSPAQTQLSDVVVVGYGTQKKSDLTGSVASVPAQALRSQVSSFERVLQGSVAGVQVTQSSGQPGSSVSIRIRGGNSITGGNEPLYVIDGFPVYSNNAHADAGVTNGPSINALASLNPGDIESIDVLKDASATAIYGSRGANGVVIITTRKGKAGRNTVNYDGYYGVQEVTNTVDVLTDAREWARLKNEARVNAGKTPYYTEAQIAALPQGTDWQRAALRTAPMQSHQLTISGGDEKTKYAISGNYFKQEGVLLNTDFERYSARLNFDRNINTRFKTGISFTASRTRAQVADNSIVRALLLMPPVIPVYDAKGRYTYQSEFETPLGNPVATLVQETNNTNTYRVLGNAYGEYKILENLTARVSVGADIIHNKQNYFIPSSLYKGANSTANSVATVGTKTAATWLNENTLNYVKQIGKRHSLNILAGFTQQAFRSESVTASSEGFVTDLLRYNDLGSGSVFRQPGSGSAEWALQSFLGRINYTLDDKYLFTVTGRADGSSRFGKNNKWGYFPSAAFGWIISKEKFIRLPDAVDNLKFRISAGLTGNQEIGQYQSLSTLANNNYFFGGNTVVGFTPNRIGNPDLSWETTAQYDAGIDLSLFHNRITLAVDAYYKKTTNLLLSVPIPFTTGQSTALQNFGSASNRGLEISLNTDNIRGDFSWNTGIVFSINRNKIISLGDGVGYIISGPSIAQTGEPLGAFYGFRTNGIIQAGEDVSKLPVYLTKNKPGDQLYRDFNGDGVITETDDRRVIGNAQPKFLGGVTNNFAYKGVELNVFFQGSYGNQLFNQNRQQLEILSGQQNVAVSALDRWRPEKPSNVIPRAYEDPASVNSDRFVEDASYLRLKALTLGYTLPGSVTSKARLGAVKFYFTAQNVFTWTQYSGYDPEVSRNEQNTLTQGIDNGVYPYSRSFTGGLNVTF